MFKFISKFIPVSIQIKTLYWKRQEEEMIRDLRLIGEFLDDECYDIVEVLIQAFRQKWESRVLPEWLSIKTAEVSGLEAKNSMLKEPLDYEE